MLIALIAEGPTRSSMPGIAAFATPTVLHFCSVLLLAAVLTVPWTSFTKPAVVLGAAALAGIVYAAIVVRRARRQTLYQPVFEDWFWHAALPLLAYSGLLIAALLLPRRSEPALLMIAGTALVLIFVGIHNAWDAATYTVEQRWRNAERPQPSAEAGPAATDVPEIPPA